MILRHDMLQFSFIFIIMINFQTTEPKHDQHVQIEKFVTYKEIHTFGFYVPYLLKLAT